MRIVPFKDLDETAQLVRQGVVRRHQLDVLAKLQAVPFHEVVKVDATAAARSENDERTMWYHPPSVGPDEAQTLGRCLWSIAAVFASDAIEAELLTIDGQFVAEAES